jgi:phosphoribosylaminoimidazole-succinocarboxamide synthase
MAKIKDEQLKEIVELQTKLNEVINNIGILETQKHGFIHEVAEVNKKIEEFKTSLEKEYGAISVDLKTGEYTEVEKDGDSN